MSISAVSAVTIDENTAGGIAKGIGDTTDGKLYLEKGTYNKTNDYGINIGKNIVIQGKGPSDKVIIDAQKNGRIFTIGSNNITFINITFTNGDISGNGGAIYNDNYVNITFINCNFINNTATHLGGAIYSFYGSVTLTDCIFTGNSVNPNGIGGAISNNGGSATLIDCTFAENSAWGGGAIGNPDRSAILTVNNCIFTKNSAIRGGAIYNLYGSAILTACIFTENSATDGGAISNVDASAILTGCTFAKNSATGSGGVISSSGGKTISSVTLTACIFTENSATGSGGTINSFGSLLKVYSSMFYKNTGNKTIYINNAPICDLKDNFYFWVVDQSNPTLDSFIADTINNPSLIGSYYYINISYLPELRVGNNLFLNYTMKHSDGSGLDNLTVNDITLRQLAIIFNNFDFKATYYGVPFLINSNNPIGLYYFSELFYQLNIQIQKTNTNVVVDPILDNVGYIVYLRAKLTDQWDNPIAGAIVNFYFSNGIFIGSAITGNDGIAKLRYIIMSELDTSYYAKYDGDNKYFSNASVFQSFVATKKVLSVPVKSVSSLSLSLNSKKLYFVGQIAIIKWKTNGVSNLNQKAVIQFIENGKVWHTANVLLKDGQYKHKFIMPHQNLDIIITYEGDTNTHGSSDKIKIRVKPAMADLIITKVKKVKKNSYRLTVKNNGTAISKKSFLKLVCGCGKYSKITAIKSVKSGKSFVMDLKFPSKGKNHFKNAVINYNKKTKESNYKNNIYRIGKI